MGGKGGGGEMHQISPNGTCHVARGLQENEALDSGKSHLSTSFIASPQTEGIAEADGTLEVLSSDMDAFDFCMLSKSSTKSAGR